MDASTLFAAELVEVNDDAIGGLDQGDKDVLLQQQQACPCLLKQTKEFKKAHLAKSGAFHTESQAAEGCLILRVP